VEQSKYNFDLADTSVLLRHFEDYESACRSLLESGLALPAYEQMLKSSHTFKSAGCQEGNLRYGAPALHTARSPAVQERRRNLFESREALGFPMLTRVVEEA